MRLLLLLVPAGACGLALALAAGSGASPKVLGRAQTDLKGRSEAQRHNVVLSMRAINGKVIKPGETFSYNKAVGSWSRDKGFKRAPVSFNGSLIDAWGGGVCQTSTTLYNAALLSGLGIAERHPHRFAPAYITPGRDAAVAYPNIDLKLKNRYSTPVEIKARIEQMNLVIEVCGTEKKPDITVETRMLRSSLPQTKTLGSGGASYLRSPGKPGYEVETIRRINGSAERLSVDTYPVMHRIVQQVEDVE